MKAVLTLAAPNTPHSAVLTSHSTAYIKQYIATVLEEYGCARVTCVRGVVRCGFRGR